MSISSFELSLSQKFELEAQLRAIKKESDIEKLRSLCAQLIEAWHTQSAATKYYMAQTLPVPPR